MKFSAAKSKFPSLVNALLAVFSAILLTFAFPNFDFWFLAWFGLIPFFIAVEREKESVIKSFVLGWVFGTCFFFGTCWWLTYALIHYGGIPFIISYLLLFLATLLVGIFSAVFAAIFSVFLKRFGNYGFFAAPFLWAATEFLRFNLTGNNWNALGYSQAFQPRLIELANVGGVYLIGFMIGLTNVYVIFLFTNIFFPAENLPIQKRKDWIILALIVTLLTSLILIFEPVVPKPSENSAESAEVIVIQPNVPMSGLNNFKWEKLRERHIELAENALSSERQKTGESLPTVVIFPESPMNFMYDDDREFQKIIRDFAVRNGVSVLFNSAQPNLKGTNYYNSAVMVNRNGEKIGQYDKIHLVPFGEYVPMPEPLAQFMPTLVGNFQYGENYDLMPFGDAKGGIMICYESHFPDLSREFARRGADVLIEMTNDGYLGDTPVLRQHLASAIFRAVETNRPVLRATNVGITAYINERGEVSDVVQPYSEDTRTWKISKSDGTQTFYVKYGEWFAWLCSILSLALLSFSVWKKRATAS